MHFPRFFDFDFHPDLHSYQSSSSVALLIHGTFLSFPPLNPGSIRPHAFFTCGASLMSRLESLMKIEKGLQLRAVLVPDYLVMFFLTKFGGTCWSTDERDVSLSTVALHFVWSQNNRSSVLSVCPVALTVALRSSWMNLLCLRYRPQVRQNIRCHLSDIRSLQIPTRGCIIPHESAPRQI